MTEQRVRIAVDDHVAVVTLSRPDKHNALDHAMFEGILGAAEEVASTPGVRAVVLHGDGPSFCSGLDVASFLNGPVSLEVLCGRDGGRESCDTPARTEWISVEMSAQQS